MTTDSRRVLVLFHHPDPHSIRSSIRQHLEMLRAGDVRHDVWYCNTHDAIPASIRRWPFDAVILHTTLLCMRWSHLFALYKWRLRWLADVDWLKIAMPQDEYDHSEVLDEWLYELGVNVVFSTFDESQRRQLYPLMRDRAIFHKALTGYIDESAAEQMRHRLRPLAKRRLDIVYRATHLPYWFGSHGQLKQSIGAAVASRASSHGLKVDISTRDEDTIIGSRWLEFLASGKCVIGCESGSSVIDRRGEVRAAIQKMLRDDPSLTFDDVSRRMGAGWDSHPLLAISPRHFEAVVARTCQILVEGTYDGILVPERHYIPVRPDLSDLDEALERCHDVETLQNIADRAYEDVYLSGQNTYRELAGRMTEVLAQRPRNRSRFVPVLAGGLWAMHRGPLDPSLEVNRLPSRPRYVPPHVNGSPGLVRWVLGYPARSSIAVRLLMRDPALLRLLVAYLRSPQARREARVVRVLEDLLVLAIIRQAHAGDLTAGDQFRINLMLDRRTGRLGFVSRTPSEPPAPHVEQLLSARLVARLHEIYFDHSAIGNTINHLITTHRWLRIPVPNGKMRLEALVRVVNRTPEAGISALNVYASGGRPRRGVWRSPAAQMAKGISAIYIGLTDPPLRRILATWLSSRSVRKRLPARELAEDVLKLGLLRRAHAGRVNVGMPFNVSVDVKRSSIHLTSRYPNGNRPQSVKKPESIKSITWNHAAVGDSVYFKFLHRRILQFQLPGGRHQFDALAVLATARPEIVADAVLTLPGLKSRWVRIWVNPGNYLSKGFWALRSAAGDAGLRKLAWQSRRASLGWDRVLEDTLKLSLARRGDGFELSSLRDGHVLKLVSHPPGQCVSRLDKEAAWNMLSSRDFAGVEWDHSRVGNTLSMRSLGSNRLAYLPDGGRHRFETLSEVARFDPAVVLDALTPMLAPNALDAEPVALDPAMASTASNG